MREKEKVKRSPGNGDGARRRFLDATRDVAPFGHDISMSRRGAVFTLFRPSFPPLFAVRAKEQSLETVQKVYASGRRRETKQSAGDEGDETILVPGRRRPFSETERQMHAPPRGPRELSSRRPAPRFPPQLAPAKKEKN